MVLFAGLGVLLVLAAIAVVWSVSAHGQVREDSAVPNVPVPPPSAPTPVPRAAPALPTPAPRPASNPTPRPVSNPTPRPVQRSGPEGTISDKDLEEVRSLVAMGRPISALRLYRDKTGATLAQAKEALASLPPLDYTPPPIFVDPPAAAPPPPPPPPAPPATPAPSAAAPAPATPAPTPAPAPAAPTPAPAPAVDDYNEDDETVRALVHFDRMAEAVQMYQAIHGVDVKTARAAVEKMAPH